MSDHDIPTKEIGEMLDVVSSKLPKIIKDLMAAVYSEEAATNMGKAVGIFYKQLVDNGIKEEDALRMTEDYIGTLKNFSDNFNINK